MFHDSLVILGIFSLLGHFWGVEVDTLFVTALLTSLSFSVHDTVVVYDRIRETIKNHPKADFETVVNKALSETMSRSVNNSLTIIFMLTCLWLFRRTVYQMVCLCLAYRHHLRNLFFSVCRHPFISSLGKDKKEARAIISEFCRTF